MGCCKAVQHIDVFLVFDQVCLEIGERDFDGRVAGGALDVEASQRAVGGYTLPTFDASEGLDRHKIKTFGLLIWNLPTKFRSLKYNTNRSIQEFQA